MPQNKLVLSFTQAETSRGTSFICGWTLFAMKGLQHWSRWKKWISLDWEVAPALRHTATSSDRQWELVLDALYPSEDGAFHKYTHTRRNTAAWFIKGQMWLFSPLPLKARFLCGCQRKLSEDTHKNTLSHNMRTHIRVGKNSEFTNVLSVYECEFELNWRHPIGCGTGTEIKGRGIYWIKIQISSNTTRTDKSGVLFKVSSIIHVFLLHFRREKKL